MTETAPKPTGRSNIVTLEGALFAWNRTREQPVLLAMPGSDLHYIACFSSAAKLREVHARARAPFDLIKQIEDGPEFLASVAATPGFAVIIDPWFTFEGRLRFTQVYP
jgi:hypothetical protein